MASTRMMLTSICLSVMVCGCMSQRWRGPRPRPNVRFTEACRMFDSVKIQEKAFRCNWNVLDKVADLDEKVNIYPFKYMRRLYRWSREGKLCYPKGGQAVEVSSACEAMELSCRETHPEKIDHCWRVLASLTPSGPPQGPQGPQAPKPKPPGRGI